MKSLSESINETLARVRAAHAKGAAPQARERQSRRAALERLERARRIARDPSLGLPQGPSMLSRALAKPSGAVALAIDAAYQYARGDERRVCTLLLGSNPGSGKTTAAVRVVLAHVERGSTALYVRAPVLPHVRNHATQAAYDRAREVDLLVVDELGMEAESSTITALLLERFDNERVTIGLGNLSQKEMVARYLLLDDPRMRSRFSGLVRAGFSRPVVALTDRDFRGGEFKGGE